MFFKHILSLKVLIALLLFFGMISLFIGVISINVKDILNLNSTQLEIITLTRIPRLIAILLTGMSLSICGLIMQQLTQNKFVSPTTAGTMDCAKFGILISLIFFTGASFFTQAIIASIFALLGSFIFIQILRKIKLKDVIFVPLIGLMFGGIISAITTFFAYALNYIQNIQGWLQGSMANVMQGNYELLYISLPLFILAYFLAHKITIVGMGEDIALNLGISYNGILFLGLMIVSIITSLVIVSVGIIPFLGLIIPNLVALYLGDNLRKNLIYIALCGALFLLVCDIISRLVIFPFEMPLSFLTLGMIGIFILVGLNGFDEYALKSRFLQIAAIIIVAICIAVSTVIFQTLCNNKILTPAIIGLDSLYMLLQSALIFSFGAANLSVYKNDINFLITLVCMVVFSLGLYKILFSSDRSIYLIMLLGLVFGTLFSTLSSFFEVLIDPDEFMVIQGRMFASFDNIAFDVLILAYIISFLSFIWIFRYMKFLDPLNLGKDLAINLGINYQKISKQLMIIIAILTSISTALVGPITFLGLLVVNITYELFKTAKHSILLSACILISILALLGGVFFVSRVFDYNATISVVINFLGGIYFIYLVLKGNKL
ncbi:TPA: iron chelate uptake ABC transporter family permease subunit [Campylobacter jejuni]|nr:iron chelate uptake ABC transporter family permease subunit [Campylobacter jejuni]